MTDPKPASSDDPFTDDDVTAASSAFIKIWWSDGHVETDEAMTAVLSAVAPSIAARARKSADVAIVMAYDLGGKDALRQAADEWGDGGDWTLAAWLRARADHIERGEL
jgi:hypothetical protein